MKLPDILTPDGRLSRMMITAPPSLHWRSFDVGPRFTISRSVNGPPCDPEKRSQFRAAQFRSADKADGFVVEFGHTGFSANLVSAVQLFVGIVFQRRSPAEVFNTIVAGITIVVRSLMLLSWGRTNKNLQDKTVKHVFAFLSLGKKTDVAMSIFSHWLGFPNSRPPIIRCSTVGAESPERTDRIAVSVGNRFPNFTGQGINIISHGALQLRFWLGLGAVSSSHSSPQFLSDSRFVCKGDGHELPLG